jgi:hypothetical protein
MGSRRRIRRLAEAYIERALESGTAAAGALGEPPSGPATKGDGGQQALSRARESLLRRYETQSLSIKIHGFLFAIGAAGFVFLNSVSTPFPWAFFPIAGWAIGLGGHLRAFLSRRRELSQISRMPDSPDENVKVLRAYQRSRGAWAQHLTAFVTANAYLWGINIITSFVFPWAAIVTGAWGVGLACHWMANSHKRKRLADRLGELGTDPGVLRGGLASTRKPGVEPRPFTDKARAIAEGMASRYKGKAELRSHWAEIAPLIGTAVSQIEELEAKSSEFDRMTASISDAGLERDLAELRDKRALAETALLRQEYDRSIAQYETHLKASSELRQHREILNLRLSSALNLIKQLEIDSVRLANLDGYEEPGSLALLRAKTTENQAFLEDYRNGLERLGSSG